MFKHTDKKQNFLDEYIDLDSRGSYLAERESVQIGNKRYRFKITVAVAHAEARRHRSRTAWIKAARAEQAALSADEAAAHAARVLRLEQQLV